MWHAAVLYLRMLMLMWCEQQPKDVARNLREKNPELDWPQSWDLQRMTSISRYTFHNLDSKQQMMHAVLHIDRAYTRLLSIVLNVSGTENMTNAKLYGDLPNVSQTLSDDIVWDLPRKLHQLGTVAAITMSTKSTLTSPEKQTPTQALIYTDIYKYHFTQTVILP